MGGYFHHCHGHIALLEQLLVQGIQPYPGGEDFGGALAAKEDHPLVEHAQALHLHPSGSGPEGGEGHAVEEPQVHGVEAPVEGHRLHVDVGIKQLRFAALHRLGPAEDLLPCLGGIKPQVLDTVLITI